MDIININKWKVKVTSNEREEMLEEIIEAETQSDAVNIKLKNIGFSTTETIKIKITPYDETETKKCTKCGEVLSGNKDIIHMCA